MGIDGCHPALQLCGSPWAQAAGQNLLHFGVSSHHGLGLSLPAVRLERRHLVFHPYIGWSLAFISQPHVISHLSAKQAFLPAGEHWEEEEEELTALLQISPAALPAACSSCDVTLTLCRSNPQLDACPVHENESLHGGTSAL